MSSIKKESLTNFVKMLADVPNEERAKVLETLRNLNYTEIGKTSGKTLEKIISKAYGNFLITFGR